ncbi:MAG: GTP 3',8-cyclase MoaA [Fusobacteriaceae bacterium]
MRDSHGREIDYLRISLTERCNMRCIYCMPDWGCEEKTSYEMTEDEVVETVDIFRKLGIKKVRFTGGEPLLRKDLEEIIGRVNKFPEIEEICLTTNGLLLAQRGETLAKCGLTRVNVSLDTVDQEEYRRITRGGNLQWVLEGIKKCKSLGLRVKINSVITNILNEESVLKLAQYSLENDVDLRFIELMPIGFGKTLKGFQGEEILGILRKKYELEDLSLFEGTSRYFSVKGYRSRIGFINPMSQCFCKSCNRVRVTSEGAMKRCLSADDKMNLREIYGDKLTIDEKIEYIKEYLYNKNQENKFYKEESIKNTMNEIGG